MPYRTTENMIDGLVITFVDISKLKATEQLVIDLRYADHIVQVVHEPLLILDTKLQVTSANQRFCDVFQLSAKQVENQSVYEFGDGQWNIPELRQLLESILPENPVCNDFEIDHTFPNIGRKVLLLNARYLAGDANQPGRILLAIEEVTARRRR
jgi:two-component system CheB/CheR fusion protein